MTHIKKGSIACWQLSSSLFGISYAPNNSVPWVVKQPVFKVFFSTCGPWYAHTQCSLQQGQENMYSTSPMVDHPLPHPRFSSIVSWRLSRRAESVWCRLYHISYKAVINKGVTNIFLPCETHYQMFFHCNYLTLGTANANEFSSIKCYFRISDPTGDFIYVPISMSLKAVSFKLFNLTELHSIFRLSRWWKSFYAFVLLL